MKTKDHRFPRSDYAPYEAFLEGFVDYRHGLHENPYDSVPAFSAEAQAWARGREAAKRITQATGKA